MIFCFRSDASTMIGSGHVVRCLTLACALRDTGHEVIFVCRDLPDSLIEKIINQGFVCKVLEFDSGSYDPSHYSDEYAYWLAVSQEQDALQTIEAVSYCDWLIVDHYSLDIAWESQVRNVAERIMVIDDLANRKHDCDVLLDQNYYRHGMSRYAGLLPEHCMQLLGPKYALIRPEFVEAREQRRLWGKFDKYRVERIIIFMGGADKLNVTSKVLQAFPAKHDWNGHVDVVAGAINPYRKEVESLCQDDERFHFYCAPSYYVELMAQADLAIAAGGSSIWERCCIGLPGLCIAVADNQKELLLEVSKQGGQSILMTDPRYDGLKRALCHAIKDEMALKMQIEKGLALVDGNGVLKRVITCLN